MGSCGTGKGVPREHIPWHPTVDEGKCIGCTNCTYQCEQGAISFPPLTILKGFGA